MSNISIEGGGGGGISTITEGVTPTSGFIDGYALISSSGKVGEAPIRTILTGNLSLFVNTAVGSDSYNGLSATYTGGVNGPKATTQGAIDELSSSYDTASFTVTINIAAGSLAGFGAKSIVGGGVIAIVGAGRTSTSLTAGPNDGVYNLGDIADWNVPTTASWYLDQLTLDGSSVSQPGPFILGPGTYNVVGIGNIFAGTGDVGIILGPNINAAAAADILGAFSDAGTITVDGNSQTLEAFYQIFSECHGSFGATYVFTSGFTVTNGFLEVEFNGSALWDAPFSGSTITGPYYYGQYDAAIVSFTNSIPGNAPGFVDDSSSYNGILGGPQINTQTASYQIALTDVGGVVEMNAAGANNLTVPANATTPFPIQSRMDIVQQGAGKTTVVAAGGVTINSASGNLSIAGQYSGATLYKRGTNEWNLIGELIP